jgi:excisionase family DNA binding protein
MRYLCASAPRSGGMAERGRKMAESHDFEGWVTKAEAVQITGLSMRAIERLIEKGDIRREYRRQPGRRSIAVLDPKRIDQLCREATPVTPSVLPATTPVPTGGLPAARNEAPLQAFASLISAVLPYVAQERKRFLSLPEAAEYVGAPVAFLRRCINEGRLPAERAGRLLVRRIDLDRL